MRKSLKTSITLATTGALVLGGAAFGISSAQAATPNVHTVSSSSESKIPAPVASVPEVLGGSTAVKLDSGFTDALTALKLTPGVSGDATLAERCIPPLRCAARDDVGLGVEPVELEHAAIQARLWERLAASTSPGGYLYIGHSERLTGSTARLFEPAGITTYRRCRGAA